MFIILTILHQKYHQNTTKDFNWKIEGNHWNFRITVQRPFMRQYEQRFEEALRTRAESKTCLLNHQHILSSRKTAISFTWPLKLRSGVTGGSLIDEHYRYMMMEWMKPFNWLVETYSGICFGCLSSASKEILSDNWKRTDVGLRQRFSKNL